jgi:hypothetical protein
MCGDGAEALHGRAAGASIPGGVAELSEHYREALPSNCPPKSACFLSEPLTVMRLIKGPQATEDDFASHAIRPDIKLPKEHDHCESCSCSMFICEPDKDVASQYKKLPRLRKRFVAFLQIDGDSGKCAVTDVSGHVSVWMFLSFDPIEAIVDVRERP